MHVIFISMDLQEDAVSFWLKLCVNIVNDSKTAILLPPGSTRAHPIMFTP